MPAAERLKSVPTMLDSFIPDANLVGLVQEDDESNDFDFQDEGSDVGDTREQCLPLAGGLGHRIFFNIVSPSVSKFVGLDGAAGVEDSNAIAINTLEVAEHDPAIGLVRVVLPDEVRDMESTMLVVAPNTFTVSEMQSLEEYDIAPQLNYDINMPVPPEVRGSLSNVLSRLMPSASSSHQQRGERYVHSGTDEGALQERQVLEFLSQKGPARCPQAETHAQSWSTWALEDAGRSFLRVS